MIDLLSKVLDGRISSSEALDAWPDIDNPTDDKLMRNAWHSLSHYDTDEDIRTKEPGYEARQKATLRAFRDELKSSVGKSVELAMTLTQLNSLSLDEFVRVVGPVFEHAPWIAEATWAKRPFASVEELYRALCQTVTDAGEAKQLALIRAHPDLVGRLALASGLTRESTNEQASAGLDNLSPGEIELFQKNNAAYKEKFGFPFVICARLNKKEAILNGFKVRLHNSRGQEIKTALEEIGKIAYLRLQDIIQT